MIVTETSTKKIGKDKYTNNLETNKITRNEEIILPYSIIAVDGNTLTIRQGNMITTMGLEDNPYKDIIQELIKKPTRKTRKTSKATIKGKTTNKKQTKEKQDNKGDEKQ